MNLYDKLTAMAYDSSLSDSLTPKTNKEVREALLNEFDINELFSACETKVSALTACETKVSV